MTPGPSWHICLKNAPRFALSCPGWAAGAVPTCHVTRNGAVLLPSPLSGREGAWFQFQRAKLGRRSLPGCDALPAEGWGGARDSTDILEEQNQSN